MCVIVRVGDEECMNPPELRRFMPTLVPAKWHEGGKLEGPLVDATIRDDCCLCPVNIEATCEANGYEIAKDEYGWRFTVEKRVG